MQVRASDLQHLILNLAGQFDQACRNQHGGINFVDSRQCSSRSGSCKLGREGQPRTPSCAVADPRSRLGRIQHPFPCFESAERHAKRERQAKRCNRSRPRSSPALLPKCRCCRGNCSSETAYHFITQLLPFLQFLCMLLWLSLGTEIGVSLLLYLQLAAGRDNRVFIIATLFVPVVGWVGFNILGPALNQLQAQVQKNTDKSSINKLKGKGRK